MSPTLAPEATAHRTELQSILDDMVAAGMTGMTLRIRDEHGDWTAAAGRAAFDGDALPPIDGSVRIGSNTKTFVATIVLALVAEGRIELDAPVSRMLPEFGIDERITVRMLLQHTSGVFNHTGEYTVDGPEFAVPSPPMGKVWVDSLTTSHTAAELARVSLSKPLRFVPGTAWSYSNTNYVILRLLVEKVTGHPLADELQRVVSGPLGLTRTVQPTDEPDIAEPYAHAYYRYDDDGVERTIDVSRHDPSWVSSGGDMISTTADLQTFITALVSGGLVPAAQFAEMTRAHETPIPETGYGLGLFVQDLGEHGTVFSHNGGMAGHAALMYATAGARRVLTASINYVDDPAMTIAPVFQQGQQRLFDAMFRRP
ncbi:serine hydrolase domain-containing protein [Microbacterium arabinogalactanolyticum]|uniref:serine hydrolase domain-containing protein n=1 Tax=Microbacterium arabinogalactanolyticum TaxID=69365 RepID=UPI004044C50E